MCYRLPRTKGSSGSIDIFATRSCGKALNYTYEIAITVRPWGVIRYPDPAMLIIAAFSRHAEALAWASDQLEAAFGPISARSEAYVFTQTSYYEALMGRDLQKQLWAFNNLVPLDNIASIKIQTNVLEAELATQKRFGEARPLNLDPGLLTLGKFQLATTKDQAHRVYVGEGIYAENTLRFQEGAFEPWPWTYADYRLPQVRDFLVDMRTRYQERLSRSRAHGPDE
jgi:hypothetical protein